MNNVRINKTANEELVTAALGAESDFKNFNMQENSIQSLLDKEETSKFNSQVDKYVENLEEKHSSFTEATNNMDYDIQKAEIKPMYARILVKPFKQNPFQRMKVKNGIIVDAGGFTPHAQLNPNSGKYEEQKEFIVTGCVVEVGPEVKYLKEGDVIYYRIDTSVPVPFFKQGLVSLNENQTIAVVNEGLEKRFNNIK